MTLDVPADQAVRVTSGGTRPPPRARSGLEITSTMRALRYERHSSLGRAERRVRAHSPGSYASLNVTRHRRPAARPRRRNPRRDSAVREIFLLCYLRGPAGIIVALAEQIG